jgi:hypothetical protein
MKIVDRFVGFQIHEQTGYGVRMVSGQGILVDQNGLTKQEAETLARKLQPPQIYSQINTRQEHQVEKVVK